MVEGRRLQRAPRRGDHHLRDVWASLRVDEGLGLHELHAERVEARPQTGRMSPAMDIGDHQRTERDKSFIRSVVDRKLINSFRLHGVTIAEMGRAELLGVICWLIKNPGIY